MTRGTPHLEIRWLGFSEKEIQAILKTHYVALGFDVQWPHDEDPSHEKGIDLDCTDASGQRVILAVKKIPKTEDIVQLQRLARNDAKQRIYVRIKRGTQEFEDETRRQIGRVEFWDPVRLEREMNESGLTLLLLLGGSGLVTEMWKVCGTLIQTARSYEGKPGQVRSDMPLAALNVLWDLKDRVVTLNKCFLLLQFIFEQAAFLKTLEPDEARELLAPTLEFLSAYGSRPILKQLQRPDPSLLALIRDVYMKTHSRSNWIEMTALPMYLRPGGNLPSGIERLQPWELCCEFCRRMSVAAHGVEGTLDYMLEAAMGTLSDQN